MLKNPSIIYYEQGYAIRFVRKGGNVFTWIQDLSAKKLKSSNVTCRSVVIFPTKQQAEIEIHDNVIPYISMNKSEYISDITGW
jgi:hypothetical protein